MLVVSDTTTITNLLKINLLHLAQKLYGTIIIPRAVYDELAKKLDQKKLVDKSRWIKVKEVTDKKLVEKLRGQLDIGES